jgi:hypothetical protein
MTVLSDRINGRVKGRAVPDLQQHTFQDSGITVKLHKLSPMTSRDLVAQIERELAAEKPEPPIVEVDYGSGKVRQPHTGHPVYVDLLKAWNQKVNELANDRLFRLACLDAVEMTIGDEERAAIARKKRLLKIAARLEWEHDPDLTDDENDQLFYIKHIACASPDDLTDFYKAVATRSQPTEAAIEQHKASFPGDVSRPVDLEL